MNGALGRDWLATHLPHQGGMNLLDGVEKWDATRLHAISLRHGATNHPLRRGDELPITAGIELGAQAAAAHGAASSSLRPPRGGFLASLRAVAFHARRLDDIPGPLDVVAEHLGGSEAGVLYRFAVSSAGRCLVEGRVTVAFPR